MQCNTSFGRDLLQTFVMNANAVSLDMKEVNVWISFWVVTATALGMIRTVFSFVMLITEVRGTWILVMYPKTLE